MIDIGTTPEDFCSLVVLRERAFSEGVNVNEKCNGHHSYRLEEPQA
jgi:hypothetical protein